MKFASSSAEGGNPDTILDKIIHEIKSQIGAIPIDLGFLFISDDFENEAEEMVKQIRQETGVTTLLGCTGESVIGPACEHENDPAISLWMASLPEACIQSFHLSPEDIQKAGTLDRWKQLVNISVPSNTHLIMLGDPYSTDVEKLLGSINQHFPGCPIAGGMASGNSGPGRNVLILNDRIIRSGAIGISLSGSFTIETVVSQGCRPIGQPYIISKGERNNIQQLGIKPPLEIIRDMFNNLSPSERELVSKGLFVGRVIDEYKDEFRRGDFLIRNVVGSDSEDGSIAVMDRVQTGTTIQFHVRDAATAGEDMRELLSGHAKHPPKGALLFSCNGRGSKLFAQPNHDINVMRNMLGTPPVAGFFCAGEFGPVGNTNFIHGYTASMALFREAENA